MEDDVTAGERGARWQTYVIALVITAAIFATALYVSNRLNDKRIAEVRATQDSISIDILSLETQFDLLARRSCERVDESTILPSELRTLASRLSFLESQGEDDRAEVVRLKRLYSLLQIKDILLTEEISRKCGLQPVVILYFYSNTGECAECERQGYALTALGEKYPRLRVYSFDYNLDVAALQTLIEIYGVENTLPALVLPDGVTYGFHSPEDIERLVPELSKLERSATTTPSGE